MTKITSPPFSNPAVTSSENNVYIRGLLRALIYVWIETSSSPHIRIPRKTKLGRHLQLVKLQPNETAPGLAMREKAKSSVEGVGV